MKIEQLLKREPFGDIIEKTLSRFFSAYYKNPYEVTWKKLKCTCLSGVGSLSDGETFYCNPYLNAIFSTSADRPVFEFLRENYLHTPIRHRRLLQKIYVTLATGKKTAQFFYTHALEIRPALPEARNLLILGGNNRIILIDLATKRTWDILKWGFDQKYILSELGVRRRTGDWPFPSLRTVGEDSTWYESEYVQSVSLNRLNHKQDGTPFLMTALNTLGDWLDETVTTSDVKTYADSIIMETLMLAEGSPLFKGNDLLLIQKWLKIAAELLQQLGSSAEKTVQMAEGHGDFQNGNILVGPDNRVWIVDWEHSRQRQFAYDYLVFALQSRFPSGLAGRIHAAVQNSEYIMKSLPFLHPSLRTILKDGRQRASTLLLFLLEDLLWNVQENVNPLFSCQSGAWLLLRKEMDPALQALAAV